MPKESEDENSINADDILDDVTVSYTHLDVYKRQIYCYEIFT